MEQPNKIPTSRKIVVAGCILETITLFLFPLYFLWTEKASFCLDYACWLMLACSIVGVYFSLSYKKALRGIRSFWSALKITLWPAVPVVVGLPILLVLSFFVKNVNEGVFIYNFAFWVLAVPTFLEISLLIYFGCRERKLEEIPLKEDNSQIEIIQNETESSFKVKKIGVLISMWVTMLLGVWPYLWNKSEKAINEAYGYENLDSFNMVGEIFSAFFLPLVFAIPLSLVYLFCLKGVKNWRNVILIGLIPFAPWLVSVAFFMLVSFGFYLIFLFPIGLAFLLYIFMTVVVLLHCSWVGCKRKIPMALLWSAYSASLVAVAFATTEVAR